MFVETSGSGEEIITPSEETTASIFETTTAGKNYLKLNVVLFS